MPFDIEKARQSGNTDSGIADYLITKFPNFDAQRARESGKSDTEIAEYLSQFDPEQQLQAERPEQTTVSGVYNKYVKPAAEMGGLTAGGIIGAAAGAPGGVTAAVGGVAGAGLGYASVKNAERRIDDFINKFTGENPQSLPEAWKISPETASKDIGFWKDVMNETLATANDVREGAVIEMMGQSAGKVIGTGLQKLSAPYAKQMTPENQYYRSIAREYGVQPTPADVTQSKSLGLFESMMEKSITASDYITKFRLKEQLKPLTDEAQKLIDNGAPPESINMVGRRIYTDVTDFLENQANLKGDALNYMRAQIIARLGTDLPFESIGLTGKELLKAKSFDAFRKAQQLYSEVGNSLPKDATYTVPSLSQKAKEILAIKEKLPNQDRKMMAMLNWASKEKNVPDEILRKLDELPETLREQFLMDFGDEFVVKRDWATLQEFRSDLYNLIQKEDAMYGAGQYGQKGVATKEAGVYKQLRQALDKDLENIASAEGGNAWEAFQAANFFYREDFKGVYAKNTIKKIAAANPEKLVDLAIKPNGITEIKLLKKALGPDGFNGIKEGFTNKLLGAVKHDIFEPKFLRANLIKYGDETLKEIYGPYELEQIKAVAKNGLDLNKQLPGFQFLKTISKTYPDTIVDAIIGAPESKLQSHILLKNLSVLKTAVGKDYINEQLGEKLLEKIFTKESINETIKPATMARLVDKYGDRVLKVLFDPEKVKKINQLADVGRRMQTAERMAGNPSGTGQTIMTWGTLGIIFRNPIKGTALAITPKYMSKIYLSKFGLQYFTDGFKVPYSVPKGVELASKISAIIGNEEEPEPPYASTEEQQKSKQYNSPEDIKSAYKNGELDRDSAANILREQFGYE